MKKSILNLGKAINKTEQKEIIGGIIPGGTCNGFEMHKVNHCNECVNTILPGAPTLCHNNCCVMAY